MKPIEKIKVLKTQSRYHSIHPLFSVGLIDSRTHHLRYRLEWPAKMTSVGSNVDGIALAHRTVNQSSCAIRRRQAGQN
ncbi:hypothetical protein O181_015429 [Austropuccinia psidii MF-1]|uniref:Uncharacterized protein n=1 Tax=Austropuccinia psidii MF-1 TaxID=1389203 RepID=A0A9Q3C207_9BASI|nr:hypothetical protein [Austropuccinia psidii MF-1]